MKSKEERDEFNRRNLELRGLVEDLFETSHEDTADFERAQEKLLEEINDLDLSDADGRLLLKYALANLFDHDGPSFIPTIDQRGRIHLAANQRSSIDEVSGENWLATVRFLVMMFATPQIWNAGKGEPPGERPLSSRHAAIQNHEEEELLQVNDFLHEIQDQEREQEKVEMKLCIHPSAVQKLLAQSDYEVSIQDGGSGQIVATLVADDMDALGEFVDDLREQGVEVVILHPERLEGDALKRRASKLFERVERLKTA